MVGGNRGVQKYPFLFKPIKIFQPLSLPRANIFGEQYHCSKYQWPIYPHSICMLSVLDFRNSYDVFALACLFSLLATRCTVACKTGL